MHVTTLCEQTRGIQDSWRLAATNRPNNVRQREGRNKRSKEYITKGDVLGDVHAVNEAKTDTGRMALPQLVVKEKTMPGLLAF